MNIVEVKKFLKENIRNENEKYFGFTDDMQISQITNNWFNDNENYDGRWQVIKSRVRAVGKVLDMSAGCGTFVLNGLHNGYDVYGIEPEDWKREYFKRKILASSYPSNWNDRIVYSLGEALPYEDESFDLITTFQTLEHVQDVNDCIQEMLRVLKHGGILYIRAPDYNCFYEPHYRIPFLPTMNKRLAARYLQLLRRPILGLETLRWTTEKKIIQCLKNSKFKLDIKKAEQFYSERNDHFYYERRKAKIEKLLPGPLRLSSVVNLLNGTYNLWVQVNKWAHVIAARVQEISMVGRCEKHIDLWVIKE